MVIKKIIDFLDYSFYRITKVFSSEENYNVSTSIVILALAESLYIINIIGVIVIENFSRAEIKEYSQIAIVSSGIVYALFALINFKRYDGKYLEIEDKWKNESFLIKIIKGIVITIFVLLPIVFPAIILNLKDYTQ